MLKAIDFQVNPYNPCVANRIVNGKQHIITWHVDDLKYSHVDSAINDKFLKWLNKKYASDGIGEVKSICGISMTIWQWYWITPFQEC